MLRIENPELSFAIHTTRQAALLVKQIQSELVSPALTKSDLSPVTVADYASQALVGALLEKAFPQATLVAEEDAQALRKPEGETALAQVIKFVKRIFPQASASQVCDWIDRGSGEPDRRFWTLDPIDGTKGFLRGEQYAVALALVEDGQVQLGVLGCPNLSAGCQPESDGPGSLVVAARGQGAWVTLLAVDSGYNRLQTSSRVDPAQAILLRSVEAGHTNVDQVGLVAKELGTLAEPLQMDSQGKYAVLAAGKGDLLLRLLSPSKPNYREKIWDQAAGSLVLEEAGGRISDLDGRPLDFTCGRSLENNRGVLASNRWLHAAALEALRRIGA
jgi:3'(2'), 5'-bisphosphate nucleotidase